MKWKQFLLLISILPISYLSLAQRGSTSAPPKVLACPFEHGSGREPKEAFTWDPPDQKVIMISQMDSIVRSCIKGKVVKVQKEVDNNYEIVLNVGDYYFWYYGEIKPKVKRGEAVSAGQAIGIYTLGSELEFRMFKFDEMIDPRELLECKVPKAQ